MKLILRKIATVVNLSVVIGLVAFGIVTIPELSAKERYAAISKEDMHCLQQNIYFEARNQSINGQIAVGWVTLHRVDNQRFPSNICDVVWQSKQFSWTHDGKADVPNKSPAGQRAWEDAGLIAKVVAFEWVRGSTGPVKGATHYHANYVSPFWAKPEDYLGKVGVHLFYK